MAVAGAQSHAQDAAPPPGPISGGVQWPAAELDQMLGPIALYPDPLIAIILPAATQPSQIVAADRYVSGGGDPNQVAQQPWDPSVQALAHYPNVLKWMDDNVQWTTELGQAFASQQSEVMDSIQRLRGQAQSLGNLQSTPQENVVSDDGDIDIEPVNPDEIYIPDYEPDVIYTQPGIYCTFGIGFPIGGWLGFDWDWHHHHLISWGPGHPRPHDWWQRSPGARHNFGRDTGLWRPNVPRGGRVIIAGGDRGYGASESRAFRVAPRPAPRSGIRPAVPASLAPRVDVTVIGQHSDAGRLQEAPREAERSSSESVFGGSASSREIRQSSARGESSRASGGVMIGGGGGHSGGGGGGGGGHSGGGGGGGGGHR
jgi:hypothetical protein